MIHAKKVPIKFWAEAMNRASYIINRVIPRFVSGTKWYIRTNLMQMGMLPEIKLD